MKRISGGDTRATSREGMVREVKTPSESFSSPPLPRLDENMGEHTSKISLNVLGDFIKF